jgi:hypothetical protein
VLIDLPGLAFFTTYALLVLFWAEIYYQVRFQFNSFLTWFCECCCAHCCMLMFARHVQCRLMGSGQLSTQSME